MIKLHGCLREGKVDVCILWVSVMGCKDCSDSNFLSWKKKGSYSSNLVVQGFCDPCCLKHIISVFYLSKFSGEMICVKNWLSCQSADT